MRVTRPTLNLTEHLERVLADMCARLPEFAHVAPRRMLACVAHSRRGTIGGTYAKIVPMRFQDGTPFKLINGSRYALPQIPTEHGDVLYLIYIYLPRFFDQPFERRLLTLIHELYHIAPNFDGTIRRVSNQRAHGASRAQFNANLEPMVQCYLAANPPEELMAPLRADLAQLTRQMALVGRSLPMPKSVRLP